MQDSGMSAFAAEGQFGRPALLPQERQIVSEVDHRPLVCVGAQGFAVPGDTVGSGLAPGGEAALPVRHDAALGHTTCNVRNEVSSHVLQLPDHGVQGDHGPPVNFPIRTSEAAAFGSGQLRIGARMEMGYVYGRPWTGSGKNRQFRLKKSKYSAFLLARSAECLPGVDPTP